MSNRTTTEIIDQAIKENSKATWLLYIFATAFVIVGLGVIVHSTMAGNIGQGFVGAVASALCYPAINNVRSIRQENITLRTLEFPLSHASTEEGAANMLKQLMKNVFLKKGG